MQDTFFDSDRKSVAMVTAYYGTNGGKILRRELLPQFLINSHEIWQRCLPWSVDVQDTFFDSDRKSVAMVTAYYGTNGGKILRRELLPQFFTNSHEIWQRCLPWSVDVQDTFFDSDRKSVAMVTAYYGTNGGKILRRELLPQFFTNSHEIWQRCLPWSVDVQDTFFDSDRKSVAMVTAYYGKNGGKILRRELLPQFFTNSHEIWHRCLPWGVDVQDTFFDSGRKCVAMVTAYYGKNGGKILRRELLPQFFTNSHEIWHRCLPWGVDVQDTFFDSGRKCVAMVTAYYGKNGGKSLRRELLPQFFTNSHEIWHRCLPWGVDVQDTFFDSGRKCVAMVTAYYGKNGGKNLASRTTSSVFHQFS